VPANFCIGANRTPRWYVQVALGGSASGSPEQNGSLRARDSARPAAGPARCTGITVVAPPNPGGDRGNRGPARWNRCHAGLSPGPAWYNRRAIRPKRRNLPPEAHALGRLNPSGCAGYNERGARLQREGPRLQRAPLSLNSTGLLLAAAVRSLLATSPRVTTPLPTRIRGGYDGSIGILRT
jgi:hypothetical protein